MNDEDTKIIEKSLNKQFRGVNNFEEGILKDRKSVV